MRLFRAFPGRLSPYYRIDWNYPGFGQLPRPSRFWSLGQSDALMQGLGGCGQRLGCLLFGWEKGN